MSNLLIYGGSFDPIHNGHLALLRAGIQHLQDDIDDLQVLVVPAYKANFKNGHFAPYSARLEMVENALKDDWFLKFKNIRVDDYEGGVGRRVYTHEYLDYVGATPDYPVWVLCGADILSRLDNWDRAELLAKLSRFIVGVSRGDSVSFPEFHHPFSIELLPHLITGHILNGKRLSSTSIRAMLAAGEDVSKHVPAAALDYIKTRGLYKAPAEAA